MGWLEEGMENLKLLPDAKIPFPLSNASPPPYGGNSARVGVIGSNRKSIAGLGNHHRSPSESNLIEGQPSWLDDLLNEPDSSEVLLHRGHHRSASDTFAYIGAAAAAKAFDIKEETRTQNCKDSSQVKFELWPTPLEEKLKKDLNAGASRSAERQDAGEEASLQNLEGFKDSSSFSQVKPSAPKSETKRAKQQCAHRSRVRKLQYISQLERTVQVMQAQGFEISAELEFLDHQNLILSMENRALKQRLDSLAQEQIIKQLEHEMLEREVGRLQSLYQLQRQQQMNMQQQQQQNPKNRRIKSRESNSITGPIAASVQT